MKNSVLHPGNPGHLFPPSMVGSLGHWRQLPRRSRVAWPCPTVRWGWGCSHLVACWATGRNLNSRSNTTWQTQILLLCHVVDPTLSQWWINSTPYTCVTDLPATRDMGSRSTGAVRRRVTAHVMCPCCGTHLVTRATSGSHAMGGRVGPPVCPARCVNGPSQPPWTCYGVGGVFSQAEAEPASRARRHPWPIRQFNSLGRSVKPSPLAFVNTTRGAEPSQMIDGVIPSSPSAFIHVLSKSVASTVLATPPPQHQSRAPIPVSLPHRSSQLAKKKPSTMFQPWPLHRMCWWRSWAYPGKDNWRSWTLRGMCTCSIRDCPGGKHN
jgi:hypothetical protein